MLAFFSKKSLRPCTPNKMTTQLSRLYSKRRAKQQINSVKPDTLTEKNGINKNKLWENGMAILGNQLISPTRGNRYWL